MRSSKAFFAAVSVSMIAVATSLAASVDFNDPRRALGRENGTLRSMSIHAPSPSPSAPRCRRDRRFPTW